MRLCFCKTHLSTIFEEVKKIGEGSGRQKTCCPHMKELRSRIPLLSPELKKLAVVSRYVISNVAKMGVFYNYAKFQIGFQRNQSWLNNSEPNFSQNGPFGSKLLSLE